MLNLDFVLQSTFLSTCIHIQHLISIEGGRRIFLGRDAAVGEFPYVASWGILKKKGRKQHFTFVCSCSVISPTWTLSAAHCISKPPALPVDIILHSSNMPTIFGNYTKVIETIPHPTYVVGTKLAMVASDICLLRTERIVLPQYGVVSAVDFTTLIGHEAIVAGYGTTNVSSKIRVTFKVFKPLQVFKGIVSLCKPSKGFRNRYVNNRIPKSDSHVYLCVSAPCGSLAMVCAGDSGGPLIHTSGILGVNSLSGNNCKSLKFIKYISKYALAKASSDILAPVSPVLDWITQTLSSK